MKVLNNWKRCSKCDILQPLNNYSWRNKSKKLKSSYCKKCEKQKREQRKEKNKEYFKEWYETNKAKKINSTNKNKYLDFSKKDANFILKKNIYNNISNCILNNEELPQNFLNYTIKELKKYLKKFEVDLNKVNQQWYIGHYIHSANYNFFNEEDIKKCWSLRNIFVCFNKQSEKIDMKLVREKEIEDLLPEQIVLELDKKK